MFVSLTTIAATLAVVGVVLWLISAFFTKSCWFSRTRLRGYGDLIALPFQGFAEVPRMLACVLFVIAIILAIINHFG